MSGVPKIDPKTKLRGRPWEPRVGEPVRWWYHPEHHQQGVITEIPAKWDGHWAFVDYEDDGKYATLIETRRLFPVEDAPRLRKRATPIDPTKPPWEA